MPERVGMAVIIPGEVEVLAAGVYPGRFFGHHYVSQMNPKATHRISKPVITTYARDRRSSRAAS
jgi:hypothetical protein